MGSKSGDMQTPQWIIPIPSIPSRGRDINPPSSSWAMSTALYSQLEMYCPLASTQLGHCTLIWKSAAQQWDTGTSLSLQCPSPGFLPAGWSRVGCDRKLPRCERTPFIRTDFNATLPVCFDDQGSHTNPLGLQAGCRCSPLQNKCTGVQAQPHGLNTHQIPPCDCQISSWEVLSNGNSLALLWNHERLQQRQQAQPHGWES